jgi:hypothetical protein
MVADAASVALLIKALGYGLPAAFLVLTLLIFNLLMKVQQAKTEKDREEHMAKWQSMIDVQEKYVKTQKESTIALIQNHKDEIARMFQLQERQAASLEGITHSLSIVTHQIEHKFVCPHNQENA